MSLHEYKMSQIIDGEDYPYYALVMALMRKSDDVNLYKLTQVFPNIYDELKARYNAPGGLLENESIDNLIT